jgi:hypothetical protein
VAAEGRRQKGGRVMTTKQQEREALSQIRSIISGLGKDSYVGSALNGVLRYAEENIECDAAFAAPIREMRPVRKSRPYASNMSTADYADLKKHGEEMTDDRAVCLINREFGFEASRIRILHEAEIDATKAGASSLERKYAPRKPLYCATDWNYARFNVRGCATEFFFELVNGDLLEVCL